MRLQVSTEAYTIYLGFAHHAQMRLDIILFISAANLYGQIAIEFNYQKCENQTSVYTLINADGC